jgi:Ca2+-binding RTX toxin-like protein
MKLLTIAASAAAVTALCAAPAFAAHVQGTPDDDNLHGTPNADYIYGLGGDDSLRGGAGNDHIYGGPGNDFLLDGGGRDSVSGGRGADIFNVRRGGDTVVAGPGRDSILLYHDGSADTVRCGAGVDRVQYTGDLELHDVFRRCEHVDPYSP